MKTLVLLLSTACLSVSAALGQIVPGKYILILQDPPVAARFSSSAERESAPALVYRRRIEDRQAGVKQTLASRNIAVTGSVSVLLNAIFVSAPASRAGELSALPGVAAVRPMRKFKPLLDRATQVLNGPAAWSALGGISNAGLGIKIGILDSGIDQTHPVFQDSSLPMPAGFPKTTAGHPEDAAYTSNKVIVARSYVRLLAAGSDPSNPAADSLPDDYSPRDRLGHGTGVASCAAGVSTITPGVASTGGALTIQGMAPKAYLGNYKIAGSPGVLDFATDQTMIQAVEDAVSDGMDVITTSWGSIAVTDVANDPTATAFENAAKAGAVVLAAAGNTGENSLNNGYQYPNFGSINSPSNAPDVISVGATENSHVLLPAVSVNAPGAPSSVVGIAAQPSDADNYPSSLGANSALLIDVTTLGDDGLACGALQANSLNGLIWFALIENGTCTFTVKAMNAQAAGAIGIVFYWADSTAVTAVEGVGENNFGDAAFVGPVVAISNAAGVALKSYIDANPGQTVTIAAGLAEMDIAAWSQLFGFSPTVNSNQLAGFSSTGPTPDGLMKPDLMAVGGNDIGYLYPDPNDLYLPAPSGVFMATQSYDPNGPSFGGSMFSSNGYWAADGTSFATPLTAGAAALVKQAHAGQNLRGTQIKSLLVDSAAQTITTDDSGVPVDAEWIGAGLVDAGAAVAATITAEPSTISFGFLNNAILPLTQTVTLTNVGTSAVTLTALVSCCSVNAVAGSLSGATVTASLSSGTLAAGASATLTVKLAGTGPAAGEYSGTIILQQGSTVVSRIPFMMVEGDGVAFNVNVLSLGGEGAPNEDIGPLVVQITDRYGAPVVNSPVEFSVSPRGGVTLQSVSGEPACTASRTGTTCESDRYGFVYAEMVAGAAPGLITISSELLDNTIGGEVNIQTPPNVTSVADASQSGLTTVAPGSYIEIFGTGLSNFTFVNGTAWSPNATLLTLDTDPVIANGAVLPLQIAYVTVSFDVPAAGISVPGHLLYVSPTQINAQVPWELQGQSSAQMKVTLDGDLIGNVVTVPLANAVPAFFQYNDSGIALGTDLSNNVLTTSNPATRGKVITLYANGLGPVNNQPASGDPAGASPLPSTTPNMAVVTIGGQNAQVSYSGLVPTLPGLYQLDVVVPAGISAGSQPIAVSVGGAISPTLNLPVQ